MTAKELLKRILPAGVVRVAGPSLRAALKSLRRQYAVRLRRHHTADSLRRDLGRLGLREGDLVIVWSSLSRLGQVAGGADAVIEALSGALGPSGTLVMPTYCIRGGMLGQLESGVVFDRASTPTSLGVINETFRRSPGVVRSLHPTHSLAARGPLAAELMRGHESAPTSFGAGTPFERLLERDAWCLGLAVSVAFPTFYHSFEDLSPTFPIRPYLPRRYTGRYLDDSGRTVEMQLNVHDPALRARRIDCSPDIEAEFRRQFRRRGIIREGRVGSSTSWLMRSQDLMRVLAEFERDGVTIYLSEAGVRALRAGRRPPPPGPGAPRPGS